MKTIASEGRSKAGRLAHSVAAAVLFFGVAAQSWSADAAPILQTYAQSISGNVNLGYGTFSVPSEVSDFFGPQGVSNPVLGIPGSGLVDDTHGTTAASGSLSDSSVLSNTYGANTFAGSSSATAQYGKVGAMAHATFSGSTSGSTDHGSQGMGLFRETFTITSPSVANGTLGTAVFDFSIDGSLATTNAPSYVTTSDFEVRYQVNSGSINTLFRGQVNNSTSNPGLIALNGGLSGFTLAPGTASGSGVFDVSPFAFTFGTPFDFTFGLLAYVIPGPGGTGDVDFLSTALLSGITLGVAGNDVTDFNVTSGSGTFYDANGVILPEPSSISLAALGLFGLGLLSWRRRRQA